jgi:Fe2+ or Zn2+ uptake regulation protein
MKIEMLFGGITRFATLEALSETKSPITAYQIAITKGLDPAATYRCLAEFQSFGMVQSITGKQNQTFYRLSEKQGKAAAMFLQSLKQKTSRTVDLEEWISPQMQAGRVKKIVKLNDSKFKYSNKTIPIDKILSKRIPGELSALITSSKIAFDKMFKQKNNTFILKP